MKNDNKLWGVKKIQGELRKLGIYLAYITIIIERQHDGYKKAITRP